MTDKLTLKEYVDLKNLASLDYSMGVLLSLKLLIANLTLSEQMDTEGYIQALKTAIKELSDINVNPTILTAPQNILDDLEDLVVKIEKIKQGEISNE